MAAELRVDTIKSRAGINTLNFAGDGLYFHKSVGIGTTITSDPIQVGNPGKIATGIVTTRDLFANNITFSGIITASSANFTGTGSVGIVTGTTAQRPGGALSGDIRFNTTLGTFEGYDGSAWGGLGGGTEVDTSVSSTSATTVTSFAHASYRSASIRAQIVQGSAYQTGRYLVIHDGTTVTVVEEAAIATGSMLGTFSTTISGSNLLFQVTMGSSSSATVTIIIDKITV